MAAERGGCQGWDCGQETVCIRLTALSLLGTGRGHRGWKRGTQGSKSLGSCRKGVTGTLEVRGQKRTRSERTAQLLPMSPHTHTHIPACARIPAPHTHPLTVTLICLHPPNTYILPVTHFYPHSHMRTLTPSSTHSPHTRSRGHSHLYTLVVTHTHHYAPTCRHTQGHWD